jgi:hypothetical protein
MENWAMRPAITVACVSEMLERVAQPLHPGNLSFEFGNVLRRQFLYFSAGTLEVVPQSQQVTDPFDGEAELTGAMNESQPVDVGFDIESVSAILSGGGGNETYILIVTYHFGRYA